MSTTLPFTKSEPLTLGVELELQILNTRDYDLTRAADELLRMVEKKLVAGDAKHEITQGMLEISTAVHHNHRTVLEELQHMRDTVVKQARRMNVAIAGGGTHPFQRWQDQKLVSKPRFLHLHSVYGYLTQQFTVFGQHVHIGVPSGDAALKVAQGLARYVPQFIALSASSPFSMGVDTGFNSARTNVVNAFPLTGLPPDVGSWQEFEAYFEKLRVMGVVESMKDFYWDIRPKPEYGTVEVRVFDTPLTVERAAALAGYAQTLAARILDGQDQAPSSNREVYAYNRFLACRYGLDAEIIDPIASQRRVLHQDIARTLDQVETLAHSLGAGSAISHLRAIIGAGVNDSTWLRMQHAKASGLSEVARLQSDRWMGEREVAPVV